MPDRSLSLGEDRQLLVLPDHEAVLLSGAQRKGRSRKEAFRPHVAIRHLGSGIAERVSQPQRVIQATIRCVKQRIDKAPRGQPASALLQSAPVHPTVPVTLALDARSERRVDKPDCRALPLHLLDASDDDLEGGAILEPHVRDD